MKKAQASIELIIILAIALFVLVFILYYSGQASTKFDTDLRTAQAEGSGKSVVQSAEMLFAEGEGSRTLQYITIPEQTEGVYVSEDRINTKIYIEGRLNDIPVKSNVRLCGALPQVPGNYWVTLEVIGDCVHIGRGVLLAHPSSVQTATCLGNYTNTTINITSRANSIVNVTIEYRQEGIPDTVNVSFEPPALINLAPDSSATFVVGVDPAATNADLYTGAVIVSAYDDDGIIDSLRLSLPLTISDCGAGYSPYDCTIIIFPREWDFGPAPEGEQDYLEFLVCNNFLEAENITLNLTGGELSFDPEGGLRDTLLEVDEGTCNKVDVYLDSRDGEDGKHIERLMANGSCSSDAEITYIRLPSPIIAFITDRDGGDDCSNTANLDSQTERPFIDMAESFGYNVSCFEDGTANTIDYENVTVVAVAQSNPADVLPVASSNRPYVLLADAMLNFQGHGWGSASSINNFTDNEVESAVLHTITRDTPEGANIFVYTGNQDIVSLEDTGYATIVSRDETPDEAVVGICGPGTPCNLTQSKSATFGVAEPASAVRSGGTDYIWNTTLDWLMRNPDTTPPDITSTTGSPIMVPPGGAICINVRALDQSGLAEIMTEVTDPDGIATNYSLNDVGLCAGVPNEGIYGRIITLNKRGLWTVNTSHARDLELNWGTQDPYSNHPVSVFEQDSRTPVEAWDNGDDAVTNDTDLVARSDDQHARVQVDSGDTRYLWANFSFDIPDNAILQSATFNIEHRISGLCLTREVYYMNGTDWTHMCTPFYSVWWDKWEYCLVEGINNIEAAREIQVRLDYGCVWFTQNGYVDYMNMTIEYGLT